MKKRILALALAGTTAFSVFGAAMSANAASIWDGSAHFNANNDSYYKHYEVPGTMHWDVTHSGSDTENLIDSFYYAGTAQEFNRLETISGDNVYTAPWATNEHYTAFTIKKDANGNGDIRAYDYDDESGDYEYFTTYGDFADGFGYTHYTATGDWGEVDSDANGNTDYVIAQGEDGNYYMFTIEYWDANYGSDSQYWENGAPTGNAPYKNAHVSGEFFLKDGSSFANGGQRVLTVAEAEDEYTSVNHSYFMLNVGGAATGDAGIVTNMHFVQKQGNTVLATVYTGNASTDNSIWFDYGSNHTVLNTVEADLDSVLAEPVETDGTVYLYDYLENFPSTLTVDEIGDAWDDGNLAELISDATRNNPNSGTIEPELGYVQTGLRGAVIDTWELFLDDLGISDLTQNGLTQWASATLDNYSYTYTDDVVYRTEWTHNGFTVYLVGTEEVDVYNFAELIEDIVNLAPSGVLDVEDVQTSELVYLMQQYDKYMDGYVDVNPVETDDWGDLLVALAEAPTEDEFATANAYKRYTNAVEDLVEQYTEADTSVAVEMAEADLYDFVTDYFSTYRYSTKADTTELANAIDSTYFNYNWKRSITVDNVTYPAEVYGGRIETDGVMGIVNQVDSDYGNSWALYPAGDYYGSNTGAYPGVTTSISSVNDSYFWFYNVYNLAYNVYSENEYQSVLDLMTETLNEAIANLTPYSVARPSGVLAAEEQNDRLVNLIETDYLTAMWSDVTKISTYVTERVMNDEIGPNGAKNAADIADVTADETAMQRNQTDVTRTDINNVSSALSEAQAALTALRDDEDNYNAAQANALEAAIEDCEYIIDIYNGDFALRGDTQTVNGTYNGRVGDKDQILKSDITDAVQAVDDAINFKNVIMGWYDSTGDGDWMYGVADTYDSDLTWGTEDPLSGPHYLNFGWAKIGNTWFYFDEEGIALKSDWLQVGNDWYYFNSNCGAAVGWAKVNNQWYYFNGGCRMMTGWVKVDGNYYYLSSSGAMVTGWCQVGGKWYYLSQASNSLGQMLYSTTTPDGYQVGADGALVE